MTDTRLIHTVSAPDGERVYSSSELAELLGVTPSAVTNWRKRGAGSIPAPHYADSERGGYWSASQVRALVRAQRSRARAQLVTAHERLATARRIVELASERLERLERAANRIGAYDAPIGGGTDSRFSERTGP